MDQPRMNMLTADIGDVPSVYTFCAAGTLPNTLGKAVSSPNMQALLLGQNK